MASALEPLLRQDRRLVAGGLVLIIILAWSYLLAGAGMGVSAIDMMRMPVDMAMQPALWTPGYVVLMFCMWWVMMIAMMLPSAAPVVLLAAALNRHSDPRRAPYGATGFFVMGYLLAWAGFSVIAVFSQWLLQVNGVLSAMLVVNNAGVAALLLLTAACWQVTPLKQACLRQCRAPVKFLTEHRRPGNRGALLMGLEHGLYCLGCCWFLMLLLFVGGVMNFVWIVGLAVLVLIEKLLPFGRLGSQLIALVLAVWGSALLLV